MQADGVHKMSLQCRVQAIPVNQVYDTAPRSRHILRMGKGLPKAESVLAWCMAIIVEAIVKQKRASARGGICRYMHTMHATYTRRMLTPVSSYRIFRPVSCTATADKVSACEFFVEADRIFHGSRETFMREDSGLTWKLVEASVKY